MSHEKFIVRYNVVVEIPEDELIECAQILAHDEFGYRQYDLEWPTTRVDAIGICVRGFETFGVNTEGVHVERYDSQLSEGEFVPSGLKEDE